MIRQRGIGLAELMVALAVGMLAMLMAAGLLVSANAAYVAQLEAAAVDDGGRYALEIITRAVRQAAFVDWERDEAEIDPGSAPARLGGLDARTLKRDSNGIAGSLGGAVNGSDVLAVRFAGAGAGPGGDGSVISCAGFGVGAQDDGWSIFYVGRNAAGVAELRCKYRAKNGWGADAVVSGVDSFQVLYGLDTDTPADGVANEYVSASVLDALDAALVLAGATEAARDRERTRRSHWKRITSIRVALLVHGAKPARTNQEPLVFDLFGSAYSAAFGSADLGVQLAEQQMSDQLRQRERRMFASTVLLRNASVR
jgi:type IV pilus assembly protein PilW